MNKSFRYEYKIASLPDGVCEDCRLKRGCETRKAKQDGRIFLADSRKLPNTRYVYTEGTKKPLPQIDNLKHLLERAGLALTINSQEIVDSEGAGGIILMARCKNDSLVELRRGPRVQRTLS